MEIDFCDNSLSALRCYLAIQLCHLFTENHKEVKILPGWIFVPSKRHLIRTVAEGGGGEVTQWGESLGSEELIWGGGSGYCLKLRGLLWETKKASRSVEEWELKLNDKITGQPGGSLGDEVIVVMMCKTRAEANNVTEW